MRKVIFLCLCLFVSTLASSVTPVPATLWQPPDWVSSFSSSENCAYLVSSSDDPVLLGQTLFTVSTNATFSFSDSYSVLWIYVNSVAALTGNFKWPSDMDRPEVGYYGNLTQYTYPYVGNQLSWSSYACNTCYQCNGTGWVAIDSVQYKSGQISQITMRFQYQCNTTTNSLLSGFLSWNAAHTAYPPGPIPTPGGLWEPSKAAVPASGNYIYLESQPGDIIGGGVNHTFLSHDAQLTFTFTPSTMVTYPSSLSIQAQGWNSTYGTFQLMAGQNSPKKGFYANTETYNYALASASWGGPVGWCDYQTKPKGWFAIDEVQYSRSKLKAVKMRFEVRCSETSPALHGALNWNVKNPLNPPLPTYPPPANLWTPPKYVLPESGNYVYLEGEKGAIYDGALNFTYTTNETYFSVKWLPQMSTLFFNFSNTMWDQVQFRPVYNMERLERGYYENAQPTYGNPARGRMGLTAMNCTYNGYHGWMVVDHIEYKHQDVSELTARFEVVCNNSPLLRVAVGWKRSNVPGPRPISPPPQDLWKPDHSALPNASNYVYIESDAGYFSNPAANYTYTPSNSNIILTYFYRSVQVSISQGPTTWYGSVTSCFGMDTVQPGYYGGLGSNYVRGSLYWYIQNSGWCNYEGWFVIDDIQLKAGNLKEVSLRFGQRCQGEQSWLHGAVKWTN